MIITHTLCIYLCEGLLYYFWLRLRPDHYHYMEFTPYSCMCG